MARTANPIDNYWLWKREQGFNSLTRCAKHDLSNCATCQHADDLDKSLPGRKPTRRPHREGTQADAHLAGTWDAHSPFLTCHNPLCCDPIDTLRRQAGDSHPSES